MQGRLVERWRHKFGGSGDDYGWSTTPAVGGGYFISGHSNSGADGTKKTPNFGSWDYAVVKVDDSGTGTVAAELRWHGS